MLEGNNNNKKVTDRYIGLGVDLHIMCVLDTCFILICNLILHSILISNNAYPNAIPFLRIWETCEENGQKEYIIQLCSVTWVTQIRTAYSVDNSCQRGIQM